MSVRGEVSVTDLHIAVLVQQMISVHCRSLLLNNQHSYA